MLEWTASPADEPDAAERPVSLPGRPAALSGHEAVRYEAPVDDPLHDDDMVAVLHLHGTYARTTVEIPGSVVGELAGPVEHEIYYEPIRVPFEPAPGRIAVTCKAPADRFGGFHDTDRSPPGDRVPAPWWAARLETHPLPYIDQLTVSPWLTDDGGRLRVRATVMSGEPLSDRLTFSLRPADEHAGGGTMERAVVEADGPGQTTVERVIPVHDPALWWPRERGEQHRYRLRATLGDSERSVTTGFRRIERNGGDLQVNGEPVSIRGVTLRSADVADVDRALECNATLVRGHAQALPPDVYEACDAAGLMVWQDLPLTGPGSFDVERGRALAEGLGRAYGRHPSFTVAAVHDAPTKAFVDGLGDSVIDGLRRRWRVWRTRYDPTPAERVAEALPTGLPSVAAVGDPGTGTTARRLFPGWDYGIAEEAPKLLDRDGAWVVGAFGAGSLGGGDVTSKDLNRAKLDRHTENNLRASQTYQATVVGRVAEACRLADRGTICDALRDIDGAGMGVYTVDGAAKPAQAALARAFAPLQAFLTEPQAAESAIVVVNDLPASVEAELSWTAGSEEGIESVGVEAGGRWSGGPIAVPADADAVTLELRTDAGTVENRYERV